MRIITFDIETSDWFGEIGSSNPADLTLALVGVHDSETNLYTSYIQSELQELWKILEHTNVLVGYNSDHFDIPLLNKYYSGDLTMIKSVDLMKEIHHVLGRRLKLDSVAEGTLNERKSGQGLQAMEWWKKGEIEKVRSYCLKDVEITKKIFDYARTYGVVKYKDLGGVREVKLDTSLWLSDASRAMTHTLGL
ncbi:hypothetical protein A2673_02545 [Candidatus Kaiserbacteria bacterium RIFCSPHIGHO2_01_FULL_50_13]|uniref:YprB ribonuclease H-like domain-containing protein n=1 Tax=Candidatus Kaiserbacteria bacterium RIFCSPLOWO2_01_FULL_50_24 TaxID=1798507 RepID=A0A1F6EMK6_9BACT|nr:MAG: hypothetical protein A2673_02545 [Candidatus Kaiserbacteria bacterium RIFCSPHIGHO2_01_FULL_50_13]OGG74868.1 MAG: hypothetical protein A3A34_03545 [Candidatus Kaiserbacteria bacterium RIFCSPLOWO2_01_FULL_50_24]OGG81420.1 MAG: hypothetical protein A3H74_03205 [Candidatus Kaiserbacteria bacterium RIFCSPLOWO2_02_FULL_51_13]